MYQRTMTGPVTEATARHFTKDLSGGERICCEGWACDRDFHIGVGPDAHLCQPVAQHVVVAGIAVDDAEAEEAAATAGIGRDGSERFADGARVAERVTEAERLAKRCRDGDGVAVEAEDEGDGHGNGRPVAAERGRDGEGGDHVGGIGVAV